MISLIYPYHNRIDYTKFTFPKFLYECIRDINLIDNIFIYDDNSIDGSTDFVQNILKKNDYKKVIFERKEIGNSTYQIDNTVKNCKSKYIIKIDNDILIPDNYFKTLYEVMEFNSQYGFLMAANQQNLPYNNVINILIQDVTHIGGVGIFRREIFDYVPFEIDRRFFGFTEFQNKAQAKGWKCGIIQNIGVLNLDGSPYWSRVIEYTEKGFSRNLYQNKNSLIDGC